MLEGGGAFTVDGEAVAVTTGDDLRIGAESRRIVVAGADGISFAVVAAKAQSEYDGRSSL